MQKARYQYIAWHAEHPFSLAQPNVRPWPSKLLGAFAKAADDVSSPTTPLFFDENSPDLVNFRAEVARLGLVVSMARLGKWNARAIDAFSFYQFGARHSSSGFDDARLFERQLPCGLEPASRPENERIGCGYTKRQVRKLVVIKPNHMKDGDIFLIRTTAMIPTGLFGISRRFRDLLVDSGMTGFSLTPILEAKHGWTDRECAFDLTQDKQISMARWFQLSVTAQTQPLVLDHELAKDRLCGVCGVHQGGDIPDPAWRRYVGADLDDVDLQVSDRRVLPDGQVITNVWMPPVIASSRLIQMVVDNKLTGFAEGKGKWGRFLPLNVE